jgi:antitoxin CcdA
MTVSTKPATKRKTSLTLDAKALDLAKELRINVSAVAEEALNKAINSAKHERWLKENAGVFAAQADWHQRNGHPLAEIMVSEGAATWRS